MPSQFSRTVGSLASDTFRYATLSWLLGGVLLATWMAWFVLGEVTVYEISRDARLEVKQAPHAVESPVSGRVNASMLRIGELVSPGDVLLELDASSEQLQLEEARTRLAAIAPKTASLVAEISLLERAQEDDSRAATAAIEGARLRANEATAAVDFADDYESRLEAQSSSGAIPRVEVLRAIAETEKLRAARDALSADVRRFDADRQASARQREVEVENLRREIVSLEGEAATARATIERLRIEIDKRSLRSPIAGHLGEVAPLRAGGYVGKGQKLATIVPDGELVIIANFNPTTALGRIREGQGATMRLDGFPWTQYGTVSARITRVASEIRDGLLRVELRVESSSIARQLMRHGLSGAVEVNVEQVTPAVLVLRAAGQLSSASRLSPEPARRDDVMQR